MDVFGVQGWLYPEEKRMLRGLGRDARLGIIEVGSYKGLSTIALSSEARVLTYAIDPHVGTYNRFMRNIRRAGVLDRIVSVRMRSLDAVGCINPRFDVLFIDGDHSYAGTLEHYDSWAKRLASGGVIALHDVYNPDYDGPSRVWYERIVNGGWKVGGRVRTVGWAVKN